MREFLFLGEPSLWVSDVFLRFSPEMEKKDPICSGVVVPGEVGILLIYAPNFFF